MRMYQFSDCDSTDSEDGIRFKTDSTRHKAKNKSDRPRHDSKRHNSRDRCHSRHRRSPSPYYRRDRKKDDRNRGRNPKSKSRSRSPKHRSKRRDGHGGSRQQQQQHQRKDHSEQDKQETSNSHRNENQTSKFGPALPPHFVNSNAPDKTEESKTMPLDNPKSDFNLDTLQQSDVLGPKLPPNSNSSTLETNLNLTREVAAMIGPPCIGPVLPPELREKLAEQANEVEEGNDDHDDDDVYGPVPIDAVNNSEAHLALEERALQMKIDQLNPSAPARIGREEWMTELPRVGGASSLGLGPRQFRANPRPDLSDRSSWTDTPEDKAKKQTAKPAEKIDLNKERELEEARRRDKEQDALIKAHKKHKKKEKSLVELHQDKLKMKKEEGADASARRPFNREIDLKVNHFDDAQKKAVLKKAQLLDSRFCQGQSKFL